MKYSKKRMAPWVFTFSQDQKQRLSALADDCANVVVALVCEKDGVVGLSLGDIWPLIGDVAAHPDQTSISVSRKPQQQYSVHGTLGKLGRKVADNELETWVLGSL